MVSLLSLPKVITTRHVALIVLGAQDQTSDTENLASWITTGAVPHHSITVSMRELLRAAALSKNKS